MAKINFKTIKNLVKFVFSENLRRINFLETVFTFKKKILNFNKCDLCNEDRDLTTIHKKIFKPNGARSKVFLFVYNKIDNLF
jgi:hypothetical protein